MIDKQEVEKMREAYGKFYEIENFIRLFISKNMALLYGVNWYEISVRKLKKRRPNKAFDKLLYHELISILKLYSNSKLQVIPQSLIMELNYLTPIRNKIAYTISLEENEYEYLINLYKELNNIIINQDES
ncbi:hypothetical protein ACJROX_07670 [Pseudalkalibacillus sp. A8]|uniref:hypothetical protein n=1 Tax=Pseudalkalibacillus sp. A8 TaxID=3382641 RepID=UPI0038B5C235